MIINDRAGLSIYSEELTAAEITSILGMEPTKSSNRGDPDPYSHPAIQPRSHWSFPADASSADESDETGFRTLRVLIDAFRERAAELALLREDCETIIWWSGDSDSTQGGFVIPADLLADLAALECDLYGTTFLGDDDDEEGGD